MKLSGILLFLLVLSGYAQSPTSPSPPDLQIIRFGWSKQSQSNLETGVSAAGAPKSPSTARADQQLETLRQHAPENKQAIEDLEERKRQSQRPTSPQNKRAPEPARYQYTLEVKNTSAKQITEVAWDYVFTDPHTRQEALRRSFVSKAKIKSDGKAKLTVYTAQAPFQVVDASGSAGKQGEQVIIKRIVYADGSVWEG